MTLDQYLDALGREAMPDYWQQMDLERRMWETEQMAIEEYDSWTKQVSQTNASRNSPMLSLLSDDVSSAGTSGDVTSMPARLQNSTNNSGSGCN